MNEVGGSASGRSLISYQNLRTLFISGHALNALLTFVPAVSVGGGIGNEKKSLSPFDIIRTLLRGGQVGFGLLLVLVFCLTVSFGILAVKYPRRWVFIAGACYAMFWLTVNFFAGSDSDLYLIPQALTFIANLAAFGGFWVKPPGNDGSAFPASQISQR